MTDWNAIGAIAAAAATGVALGGLVYAEFSRKREAKRNDERLQAQVDAQARERRAEFLTGLLLKAADAHATTLSMGGTPQAGEAAQRLRTLLEALPPEYATILRAQYKVRSLPEFSETWRKYATEGKGLVHANPDPTWVQAELGDNLAHVAGIRVTASVTVAV